VLRGTRRYILSHPNQCDKLALLPMGHASARHSAVDYTNPDLQTYPEFEQAMGNEVVLQAGQVLYLRKYGKTTSREVPPKRFCRHPNKLMASFFVCACLGQSATNWFHYIVSLNLNMQCNARSGASDHYKEPIEACGF
jgi:Cupin-like domain